MIVWNSYFPQQLPLAAKRPAVVFCSSGAIRGAKKLHVPRALRREKRVQPALCEEAMETAGDTRRPSAETALSKTRRGESSAPFCNMETKKK
jgi:hypothetical protein